MELMLCLRGHADRARLPLMVCQWQVRSPGAILYIITKRKTHVKQLLYLLSVNKIQYISYSQSWKITTIKLWNQHKYLLKLENSSLLRKIVDSRKYLINENKFKGKTAYICYGKINKMWGKNNAVTKIFIMYNCCNSYWHCKLDNSIIFDKWTSVLRKVN